MPPFSIPNNPVRKGTHMQTFIQNLPLICLLIAMIACLVCAVYYFYHLPTEDKKQALREWLKWAVLKAEKEYGGKTGQVKLREVWNQALQVFPWLVRCISFEQFSFLVDEALEWLDKQLVGNKAIIELVYGDVDSNPVAQASGMKG